MAKKKSAGKAPAKTKSTAKKSNAKKAAAQLSPRVGNDARLPVGEVGKASGVEPSLPYRMSPRAETAFAEARRKNLEGYDLILEIIRHFESAGNEAVLAELQAMPTLPDEMDVPGEHLNQVWDWYYLYRSLAAVVFDRGLRDAVPLLLDKACWCEPGEMFRRFLPNGIGLAAGKDWNYLVICCVNALNSGKPGASWWSVDTLLHWSSDAKDAIRNSAVPSLLNTFKQYPELGWMIAQTLDEVGVEHGIPRE